MKKLTAKPRGVSVHACAVGTSLKVTKTRDDRIDLLTFFGGPLFFDFLKLSSLRRIAIQVSSEESKTLKSYSTILDKYRSRTAKQSAVASARKST